MIFVDVETANTTRLDFFDRNNTLIFSQFAQVAGNQGFSFVGGVANAGEQISRVRITSGVNTIVSNGMLGNPNDDVVVMDDFLYAEPTVAVPNPRPSPSVASRESSDWSSPEFAAGRSPDQLARATRNLDARDPARRPDRGRRFVGDPIPMKAPG